MKKLKHHLEYYLFLYFLLIFKGLPYKLASYLGGFLARGMGPIFAAQRVMRKNLQKIYPQLTRQDVAQLSSKVWENLGRNFAEFPHLAALSPAELQHKVAIKGEKNATKFLKSKKPVIFFTAHFGNWELCNILLESYGFKMNTIYRPANNLLVDKKVNKLRSAGRNITMYKKGSKDALNFVKALKKGEAGGVLIDQKYSEGELLDFMGHPAYSSLFTASLAKKYDIPLVPMFVTREAEELTVHIEKPITAKDFKDLSDQELIEHLNKVIESWVNRYTDHWFWVHNRWG